MRFLRKWRFKSVFGYHYLNVRGNEKYLTFPYWNPLNHTSLFNLYINSSNTLRINSSFLRGFIQGQNLVAHNSSFDKHFLDSELKIRSSGYDGQFSCSLFASRMLNQIAPNQKIGAVIDSPSYGWMFLSLFLYWSWFYSWPKGDGFLVIYSSELS